MGESVFKVNLGSGSSRFEGALNVDCRDVEGVDLVVDLNHLPWPWEDRSIDQLTAMDSLEHLCPLGRSEGQLNIVAILREVWRVLKPGGVLYARIPSTESRAAFQDPTHVTFWNANTWWYFDVRLETRPKDWPPFVTTLAEDRADDVGCVWVLVKAVKVEYPPGEVRGDAECKVNSDNGSGGS